LKKLHKCEIKEQKNARGANELPKQWQYGRGKGNERNAFRAPAPCSISFEHFFSILI